MKNDDRVAFERGEEKGKEEGGNFIHTQLIKNTKYLHVNQHRVFGGTARISTGWY